MSWWAGIQAEQAIELNVRIEGHTKLDFDKKVVRKALRKGGGEVRKVARRLVARRAISAPGEHPGKDTGLLQRSIGIHMAKRGLWLRVEPRYEVFKKAGVMYYPAILYYGSKKQGIEPRGNYMTEALNQRRANVRTALRAAMEGAIVPRA